MGKKFPSNGGRLFCPEIRCDQRPGILGVGSALLPPPHPTGVPPIFQLIGGPGASFLEGLKPGNKKKRVPGFGLYRGIGDVVFIDQGGYRGGGDVLKFKYRRNGHPWGVPRRMRADTACPWSMSRDSID